MPIPFSQSLVIIDGLRTAIGSPFKSLKNFSAADLGAIIIEHLIRRSQLNPSQVRKVILGNVVSAGIGQNPARQAAVLAGLPVATEAFSVNHVCASGLQAMIIGMQSLLCGESPVIICGGTESASQSPILFFTEDGKTWDETRQVPSLVRDGLFCKLTGRHMGQLCEQLAQTQRISRKKQDEYSVDSHRKACQAQKTGKFIREIIPIPISPSLQFAIDERPRKTVDWDKLSSLPPAFEAKGTITAGNSSVPSDGAAGVVLSTEEWAKTLGNKSRSPLVRVLGYASVSVAPKDVFLAGVPAIGQCLKKCGLTIKDVDLFEISEAFAAQAILTRNKVKIPEDKMNIFGGDIAFGHPLGAAGTRVLVTLLHALHDQEKQIGVVCACLGGGGAIAMAVERI